MRLPVLALAFSLLLPIGAKAATTGPAFQGDPQAIAEVQAAYQKFLAAGTWRARIKTPGAEAQRMEHVAPDRMHFLLTQGNETSEMFIIGGDAWLLSGGTCLKLPTSSPFMNPREVMQHDPDTKISVTKGGAETIEGTSTRTYAITVEARGTQTRQKLYVAVGTNLPRRVEIFSDQAPTIVDYFDYNAPITINKPSC